MRVRETKKDSIEQDYVKFNLMIKIANRKGGDWKPKHPHKGECRLRWTAYEYWMGIE